MRDLVLVQGDMLAALKLGFDMQPTSLALAASTALPVAGFHTTLGIPYATLLRAVNGRLIRWSAFQQIERWHNQVGRFLPTGPKGAS